MFKINDKVKMTRNASPASLWHKGDIGRLVQISYDRHDRALYLVCFDSNCHKMHMQNGGHTWYVRPQFGKYPTQKRLMKVE